VPSARSRSPISLGARRYRDGRGCGPGVERLAVVVLGVAVATVGVEKVAALVRQHNAAVEIADRHRLDQSLFGEMVERVAHAEGIIALE
jgi:hypothetical protein